MRKQRHLLRSTTARRRLLAVAVVAASTAFSAATRADSTNRTSNGSMIEIDPMPVQISTPLPSLPDADGRRTNPYCLAESEAGQTDSANFGILLTSGTETQLLKAIPSTVHSVTDPLAKAENAEVKPEAESGKALEYSLSDLSGSGSSSDVDSSGGEPDGISFSLSDSGDGPAFSPVNVKAMPLATQPADQSDRISLDSVKPLVLDAPAEKPDSDLATLPEANANPKSSDDGDEFVVDLNESINDEESFEPSSPRQPLGQKGEPRENHFAAKEEDEPSLLGKRYRLPVAVHSVPMIVEQAERPGSESIDGEAGFDDSRATFEPVVAALTLDPVTSPQLPADLPSEEADPEADLALETESPGEVEVSPEPVEPAVDPEVERLAKFQSMLSDLEIFSLEIGHAEVRTLTIGADISELVWEDESVCQAFRTSSSVVKLVGLARGSTRLLVWAEPAREGGPRRPLAFEINVDPPVMQASTTSPIQSKKGQPNILEDFNNSLAKAFPGESLVIHSTEDGLAISGSCDRSKVAKVLRMARRTFTVPVSNRIITR